MSYFTLKTNTWQPEFLGVLWSSGSTFHCRWRGLWFKSYTGLTSTLHLWAQEMNLRGSAQPRCEMVPWEDRICASLIFLGTVCWLHKNWEWNSFPRGSRTLVPNVAQWTGEVNVRVAERLAIQLKAPLPKLVTLTLIMLTLISIIL